MNWFRLYVRAIEQMGSPYDLRYSYFTQLFILKRMHRIANRQEG